MDVIMAVNMSTKINKSHQHSSQWNPVGMSLEWYCIRVEHRHNLTKKLQRTTNQLLGSPLHVHHVNVSGSFFSPKQSKQKKRETSCSTVCSSIVLN